jgi:hypothetical protein
MHTYMQRLGRQLISYDINEALLALAGWLSHNTIIAR